MKPFTCKTIWQIVILTIYWMFINKLVLLKIPLNLILKGKYKQKSVVLFPTIKINKYE